MKQMKKSIMRTTRFGTIIDGAIEKSVSSIELTNNARKVKIVNSFML